MEDIILENKEDLKSIKKDISKVGWSLVAFTLISSIVANGVYLLGRQYFPNIANTILFQIIVGTLPIYIIGLPIILLVTRKLPTTKPKVCKKLSVGKFICILFLCFGAMYISSFISVAIKNAIGDLKGSEVTTSTTMIVNASGIWARIIFVSLIGPIMEEIIFRRVILFKLLRYGEFISIFFSSLAFGLFHGNIEQLLYAFAIGFILAYVTVKTGKIRYAIIIHIIINSFGSIIIPFIVNSKETVTMVIATAFVGFFVIACITFSIIYLLASLKKINFREGIMPLTISQKWNVMIANVGTIGFLMLSVLIIVVETIL